MNQTYTFPGNQYTQKYAEELAVSAAVPSVPLKRKFEKRFFYQERPSNAEAQLLYMEEEGEKILIHDDSQKLLGHWTVSPKGSFVAYEAINPGDEEGVLQIYACAQKEIIATLPHARHSKIIWSEDESHVLYTGVKAEENDSYSHGVYRYHLTNEEFLQVYDIGTLRKYDVRLIQSANYKHIYMVRGQVHLQTMEVWRYDSSQMEFKKLEGEISYTTFVVDNDGKSIYTVAYDELYPDGHIVQTQLENSLPDALENAKSIITHIPRNGVIRRIYINGPYLVVHATYGGASMLFLYDRHGVYLRSIPIPNESFVRALIFTPETNICTMRLSSYTKPYEIWEYNCDTDTLTPLIEHDSDYKITRHEISADNDKVSYLILRKKKAPEGPQPTIVNAYGAFGNIDVPEYDGALTPWLERGYNYVIAHVHGGGEHGQKWSEHGRGPKGKKNSINDLVAITRDLVSRGYTSSHMLGLYGVSAGGWLMLTTTLQYPEELQSAYTYAPVTNLLTFHKHGFGERWKTEFGDPDDDKQLPDLEAISPLQMKLPDQIPHTLIAVGEKDKRVDADIHGRAMFERLHKEFTEKVSLLEFAELGHMVPKNLQGKITYFAPMLAFFEETLARK